MKYTSNAIALAMSALMAFQPVAVTTFASTAETVSVQEDLADGTYTPDLFTFEGGTGRLTIDCPEFIVKDGDVLAKVHFSSSHIAYAKVGDVEYAPEEQNDDGTTYLLPLTLNGTTDIIGCTTAMGTPHEVGYTLYLGYGAEAASQAELVADTASIQEAVETESAAAPVSTEGIAPEIPGLTYEKTLDFEYATCVNIYYYEGGYKFIDVPESAQYLQIPEGGSVPEGLDPEVIILPPAPFNIYLAATSSMALFSAIGALSDIRFSSLEADGWYVDAAREAMEAGDIVYAGKYSAPDYELLLGSGCDLAVESTMILHTPKVQEMLESLGIPVFVDRSSYEATPLGKPEWVKVYGALLGMEDEAAAFFEEQTDEVESMGEVEDTGKTVAYFYMDSNGQVVVRRSDYIVPQMIAMAGGQYALEDVDAVKNSAKSSISMSMEEFYADCKDADYLVYNAAVDSGITTLDQLLEKSELFSEFKAVKEGNVWSADKYLYQATDIIAKLITDFHTMLTSGDEESMTFLRKVN